VKIRFHTDSNGDYSVRSARKADARTKTPSKAETPMRKANPTKKGRNSKPDPSPYPEGWNRSRTQALIDYYEQQPDDEAIAEAEAAYG
jgi:hypothetical protein